MKFCPFRHSRCSVQKNTCFTFAAIFYVSTNKIDILVMSDSLAFTCSSKCMEAAQGSVLGNQTHFGILVVTFLIVYIVFLVVFLATPSLQFIDTDFPGLLPILAWSSALLVSMIVAGILVFTSSKSSEARACKSTAFWSSTVFATAVVGLGQYVYDQYIK